MIYLSLKALHVAAVIAWLGGQLMTSLLLASLSQLPAPQLPHERHLLVSLRRWDRRVTTPAMLLVWMLGIGMAVKAHWFGASWLSAKLALVLVLSGWHGLQSGLLRRLVSERSYRPTAALRFSSALLLVLAALIAFLVLVKPFG